MPSRITQHRSKRLYAEEIGWDMRDGLKWRGDRMAAYNVTPGTWPYAMHSLHPGEQAIDTVHWGFRPEWAVEQDLPAATRVTIEKASTGRYFRHMWRQGQVIVPADGWYEWAGAQGHKQPWYIRLKTNRPMFLAAISNFVPYKEGPPGSGFVIVTAELKPAWSMRAIGSRLSFRRKTPGCGWITTSAQSRRNNSRAPHCYRRMHSNGTRSAPTSTMRATTTGIRYRLCRTPSAADGVEIPHVFCTAPKLPHDFTKADA